MYRNKVNRMSGKLRYWFYKQKVADSKSSNISNWWRDMKLLMGDTPVSASSPMQDLANKVCDGDLVLLVDMISFTAPHTGLPVQASAFFCILLIKKK